MSILTNPKNAVKITRAARDESLGVRNNSMVVGEVYACSFPAAIQDALSAHLYLISSGVDARDIVLSGDSADANIDMCYFVTSIVKRPKMPYCP
jgi:hypothetical protein